MGLDIYFNKRKKNEEETYEVAYFRKVNFLVKFFESYYDVEIENLEGLPISKDSVEELQSRCKTVLNVYNNLNSENNLSAEETAKKLLPTCCGFFFGNYDYNESYFVDVAEVESACNHILDAFDNLDNNERIEFLIWY